MDLRLAGKRALVTGSSSGLGEAMVKLLAAAVAYLGSPVADYVSGATIRVDGGTIRSVF